MKQSYNYMGLFFKIKAQIAFMLQAIQSMQYFMKQSSSSQTLAVLLLKSEKKMRRLIEISQFNCILCIIYNKKYIYIQLFIQSQSAWSSCQIKLYNIRQFLCLNLSFQIIDAEKNNLYMHLFIYIKQYQVFQVEIYYDIKLCQLFIYFLYLLIVSSITLSIFHLLL
ncbi:transmembrane protein, putative (macronuclear) [Tetrahymena thermophila SB210]|uniref:Transmembrane protein, putative n=1 Tax=Tetrahymena thermophila (strain SB210) TaxID=312017 RepID=W7XFG1_TETTS|nr:transmembrane protein, putative [Tetrahymena thermophila SB210]EWS76572.1 transmembrane protein, putative [Tetrahymena thermophila SB210]|eukprot:XP_012650858.1 transmembrane protein, putative [Tetrahymena thermophila SB210]